MSYQSKGTYHLSELTDPKKLVPIDPNGKQLANLCDFACGIQAIADVKNMAALMAEICNISSNFFTDFLLAKEALFGESREEDDFIFTSMSTFFHRTLERISEFFEETVLLYHSNVFRNNFFMMLSSFKTLCQLLAPSEHIPKGKAFGRRPIDPQKQIAVAVWALANQENCRHISDHFNITMPSVSCCIRRVANALVDL